MVWSICVNNKIKCPSCTWWHISPTLATSGGHEAGDCQAFLAYVNVAFLLQQVWDCFIRLKEKSEANNDTGSKIQTEGHEEKPQSVQGKSFQSEHTSDRGRWTLTPSYQEFSFSGWEKVERLKRKRKIYFPISNQIWSISVLASFFCVKFCLFRVIIFQSLFSRNHFSLWFKFLFSFSDERQSVWEHFT